MLYHEMGHCCQFDIFKPHNHVISDVFRLISQRFGLKASLLGVVIDLNYFEQTHYTLFARQKDPQINPFILICHFRKALSLEDKLF